MRNLFVSAVFVVSSVAFAFAEDWPQWRGPRGNGVSSETGLPLSWSDEENVAWKVRLGGVGVSTPIVLGNRIFVTSQVGRGVLRGGNHPTLGGREGIPGERSLGDVASEEAREERRPADKRGATIRRDHVRCRSRNTALRNRALHQWNLSIAGKSSETAHCR